MTTSLSSLVVEHDGLTSLLSAAAPSTTTATPVALAAPPPSEPHNAKQDVTKAVHTEPAVPEPQISDAAQLEGGQTITSHPTSHVVPVLSATSGPLENNPALGYTEKVDISKTAHAPHSKHDAIEDPPFATPMEAPDSANSGQVAHAEKGTKTT